MRLILSLLTALTITGCASQPYKAVAADAATTATALSMPGVVEANPMGWATVPVRIAIIEHAKTMPKEDGVPVLHMTSAVGWGAAANNLLVMAGAGPFAIAAGVMIGIGIWHSGEEERDFWRLCRWLKSEDPNIKSCTYNGVTA